MLISFPIILLGPPRPNDDILLLTPETKSPTMTCSDGGGEDEECIDDLDCPVPISSRGGGGGDYAGLLVLSDGVRSGDKV